MKKFICVLASSIKFGGRCIAGKEVFPTANAGQWSLGSNWLRPLGAAERGELYSHEYLCNGRIPGLLDIIEIPFNQPRAVIGQPEDWSIIQNQPWAYHGTFAASVTQQLVDAPTDLWLEFAHQSDRVSTQYLESNQSSSLQLVAVSNLSLVLEDTTDYHTRQPKLKRRCHFTHHNTNYDLALTDPLMQTKFFPTFPRCSSGTVNPGPPSNSVICVSLSPALDGMHYKLVAAIF